MNINNKKFGLVTLILLAMTCFMLTNYSFADTGSPKYIQLDLVDIQKAAAIAKQQDLTRVRTNVYLDEPLGTVYSGIGRLIYDGIPLATGFVIDDYTFLTSTHSIDDQNATKRYQVGDLTKFRFQPGVQNGKVKYSYHPTDVVFVSGTDLAIVHTREKMTSVDVRTMKIASTDEVAALKSGDRIHVAGYPEFEDNINMKKMYWSPSIFLTNVDNKIDGTTVDTMFSMTSSLTASGSSGSPIMNSDYKVFGVHTASFSVYSDVHLAGGVLIDGYVRNKILSNMK